jgi:hypothetical protein
LADGAAAGFGETQPARTKQEGSMKSRKTVQSDLNANEIRHATLRSSHSKTRSLRLPANHVRSYKTETFKKSRRKLIYGHKTMRLVKFGMHLSPGVPNTLDAVGGQTVQLQVGLHMQ